MLGAMHAVPVSQVVIATDMIFGATRYVEEQLAQLQPAR